MLRHLQLGFLDIIVIFLKKKGKEPGMDEKELRDDQVKENEMRTACNTNGETWNAYRILMGKPERKRPPERPRRRWVNNIKIILER
jgi:hypothetical protein